MLLYSVKGSHLLLRGGVIDGDSLDGEPRKARAVRAELHLVQCDTAVIGSKESVCEAAVETIWPQVSLSQLHSTRSIRLFEYFNLQTPIGDSVFCIS